MELDDEGQWDWVELLSAEQKLEILELEKAKQKVARSIIDDDLRVVSRRTDFDFEALSRGEDSNNVDSVRVTPTSQSNLSLLPKIQEDVKFQDENLDGPVTLVNFDILVKLLNRPGFADKNYEIISPELKWIKFCSNPWLMTLDAMVTLFSLGLYIGGTYAPCCPPHHVVVAMEWTVFTIFCVIAAAKLVIFAGYYLFSFQGVVDIFASLLPTPIFTAYGVPLGYFRWLRLITLFQVYYRNQMPFTESNGVLNVELNRNHCIVQLWRFVLCFVAALFTMSGNILALSFANPDNFEVFHTNELYLHTSLYFCFNSLLTINYGYVSAITIVSQAVLAISMVLVYIVIGFATVVFVPNLRRNWANLKWGKWYKPGSTREKHIVICGNICFKSLAAALQDIYHECNGVTSHLMRVVVLSDKAPDLDVQKLLSLGCYRKRVQYLKGRPMNHVDRERANVHNAQCILVLANNVVINKQAEDMEAMMTAISLRSSRLSYSEGEQQLLVGVLLPNSETHMRQARFTNVVSEEALKLRILAQCTRCPGWATVVNNLICNHSMDLNEDLFKEGSWLAEYCAGSKKKFYYMPLSPWFKICSFSKVAQFCYEHFELVLASVETSAGDGLIRVTINPGPDYIIKADDYVFILGENYFDAVKVWKYAGQAFMNNEAGRLAELMGNVSLCSSIVRSGDDFINYVRTSATLARCREIHPPKKMPSEELGIAVLEAHEQKRDTSLSIWKQLSNLGLATDSDSIEDKKTLENDNVSISSDTTSNRGHCKKSTIKVIFDKSNTSSKDLKGSPTSDLQASLTTVKGVSSRGIDTSSKLQYSASSSSSSDENSIFTDLISSEMNNTKQYRHLKRTSCYCDSGVCSIITNAEHLAGHIVVMGFQPYVSYLSCFLNDLFSGLPVKPLMFMTPNAQEFCDALVRFEEMETISLRDHQIFILPGDPIKYQDLKKAGLATAHTVIVLHIAPDPLQGMMNQGKVPDGDLLDSQTLFSYLKMVDGLLCEDGNVIVEILNEQTLTYMHNKNNLSQNASIGFRKLPVESSAFMWPLYAAGKVFHSSRIVGALLSSNIYQPSLVNFILQLVCHDGHLMNFKDLPHTKSHDVLIHKRISPVQQISIPPSMVGYSFGNLYQQLIAPPLHIVTLGLYRCRGQSGGHGLLNY